MLLNAFITVKTGIQTPFLQKQEFLCWQLLYSGFFLIISVFSVDAAEPYALNAKYIMAFHACNTAATTCSDPRNHRVYVAQSDEGITWSLLSGYTSYSGSVPDIIRRGNTLYVYTPGMMRRYMIDTGTWKDSAPVSASIKLSSGESEEFVDPSPVLDNNGSIVLFYLVGQKGGDPARCLSGQATCTKTFRSATEVSGSDGTSFLVDEGNRVELIINSSETASDPDVFKRPDGYVLYIARNGGIQALSSNDLRGNYQNIPGLPNGMLVAAGDGSVPAGYYDDTTGEYWTYVHRPQGNTSSISRAVHNRIDTALSASSFSAVISGSTFPDFESSYTVESPGFAVNTTNICAATLSNTLKLHVPALTFGSQYFWAEFQHVTDSLDFTLNDYGEITGTDNFISCSPSILSTDLTLHIPVLFYNDVSYWADFLYTQGLIFSLTNAGKN